MDILSMFPGLIDGFIPTYLTAEDATLENLPPHAKSAYEKIQKSVTDIIESKQFIMPDLTFHEMEYVAISWIKQESKHLTNENILSYAVSTNNKALFKFVITNTKQTETAKALAFSAFIKSIDKIKEKNKDYYLKFIKLQLNSEFLWPISVTAYATDNINGIKFLEENKLCKIINNIDIKEDKDEDSDDEDSGRYNINYKGSDDDNDDEVEDKYPPAANLSMIFPILLENKERKFNKSHKEYISNFTESLVLLDRKDLIDSYAESSSDELVTNVFSYALKYAITNKTDMLFHIMENYHIYYPINAIYARMNMKINYNNIGEIFEKLDKLGSDVNDEDYNIMHAVVMKYIDLDMKRETKTFTIDEEKANVIINITKDTDQLEHVIYEMKNYDITDIIIKICENVKIKDRKYTRIFCKLMENNKISTAEKFLSKYVTNDKIIIRQVRKYVYSNVDCDITKLEKILSYVSKESMIEEVNNEFIKIRSDQILYFYEKFVNNINCIPNMVKHYIFNAHSNDPHIFRAITQLSSLI
jgi:hypothetical protein